MLESLLLIVFGLLPAVIVLSGCLFMQINGKPQRILTAIFLLPIMLVWFGLKIFWMVITEV